MARRGDTYASFADLARCEIRGQDYEILSRPGSTSVAIIAPHGGRIEAGTATLADAVAGNRHSFYTFKGIKPAGNAALHITSHRFDEPTGLGIVSKAEVAVALHGHHDRVDDTIFIGGKNEDLKQKIQGALTGSGFKAEMAARSGLQAVHPLNICNRCRSGRGIQVEITRALREKLYDRLRARSRRSKTALFNDFVQALRTALE